VRWFWCIVCRLWYRCRGSRCPRSVCWRRPLPFRCRLNSWAIRSVAPSMFAPRSRRSWLVSRLPRRVGYYYSSVYSGFKFVTISYKMSGLFAIVAYYKLSARSVWTVLRRRYTSSIVVVVSGVVIIRRVNVVPGVIVIRRTSVVSVILGVIYY
jgi:hypothetical protein